MGSELTDTRRGNMDRQDVCTQRKTTCRDSDKVAMSCMVTNVLVNCQILSQEEISGETLTLDF